MLASKRYKDDLEKQKAERRNMKNSSNVKQCLTNLKLRKQETKQIVKACVRNFYHFFSPKESPLKTMKNAFYFI